MKTKKQIIERALRSIGVLAQDEPATAEMEQQAGMVLDSLWAEINAAMPGATFDPRAGVPDEAFVAVAQLLAAEIAPDYDRAGPSRSRAWLRVRALYVTDDRAQDCSEVRDYGCR
ncbi:hypothetical protein BVG79_01084 [Ketogulonicigenium robustum]|uniref:Uncharacterized protein n=1 Tax=Ketogulonicigenium robustum TaxID=92947 RepID=A0A1W6NZA3_9RHOB|nr:hypothetical protein [Ketogulonicigenium robustum]ARO14430.1 hypothetical protein BVG79_01084 [Ketogulonicigenium robustum]